MIVCRVSEDASYRVCRYAEKVSNGQQCIVAIDENVFRGAVS